MKKILSFVIIFTMLFAVTLTANAEISETFSYPLGNKTVIFENDTVFSFESRARIAEMLLSNGDAVAPCGFDIRCLFGHDYEIGSVSAITHCVSDRSPRCLKETFEIGECTRCGDTYTELIGTKFITCCP